MGLAILSITNLLRVGEAFTVAKTGPGQMSFQGEKSRAGENTQDVGPWASRWLDFITREREKRGHKTDKASCFQTASDLEAHWVSMVTGTPMQHLRWHALRRGGAAELWASGARGPILMLAGGWQTAPVAMAYAKPTHAWKFLERHAQPIPVVTEDGFAVVYGDWSALQWWPHWLRKEVRDAGRGGVAHGDVLGAAGTAWRSAKRRRTGAADEGQEGPDGGNSEGEIVFSE